MATPNTANLGINTSGNQQAIVKVTADGCLTQTLADLLQKNIIIEFPSDVTEDGRIDVLSANALNQIIELLSNSEAFKDLVTEVVTDPEVIKDIADAITENPSFGQDEAKRLVLVGTATLTVSTGHQITLSVPAVSPFVFTYSFSDLQSGIDASESYISSQANNEISIALRNATAGDIVTLNWNRTLIG